jgi:hypothetical protein
MDDGRKIFLKGKKKCSLNTIREKIEEVFFKC